MAESIKFKVPELKREYEFFLKVAEYNSGGSLAVLLEAKDPDSGELESWGTLSVNFPNGMIMPGTPLNWIAVDTNNLPFAKQFIEENKLGDDTGLFEMSGFCTYPVYVLNEEKLDKFTDGEYSKLKQKQIKKDSPTKEEVAKEAKDVAKGASGKSAGRDLVEER